MVRGGHCYYLPSDRSPQSPHLLDSAKGNVHAILLASSLRQLTPFKAMELHSQFDLVSLRGVLSLTEV